MGLFNRKAENETEQENLTPSSGEKNPLEGVTVEGNRFQFEGTAANDNEKAFEGGGRERVETAIRRLYSDERFHGNVVSLLSWVGRKRRLNSIKISQDDEDFKSACDVVYNRLMDGPFGPLLDKISDAALEDILVCAAGFGPVAFAAMAEIRTNKKLAAANDNEKDEGEGDE